MVQNKPSERRGVGREGEIAARLYLENKGYVFVCSNFTVRGGEIDLVMTTTEESGEKIIAFIEVKTRSEKFFATPAEAVNKIKRGRVTEAAKAFLHRNGVDFSEYQPRFDVAEVFIGGNIETGALMRVNHIKNAFEGESADTAEYD